MIVLDALSLYMIITETDFTLDNTYKSSFQNPTHFETTPLAEFVTRNTLVILTLEDLTLCLVLELVILTEKPVTVGALEHATAVIPDAATALDADGVLKWTLARVSRNALPTVANETLAVITNRPHQTKTNNILGPVLDQTTARRFIHTLAHSA